ncbi:hypothetical protein C5167_047727 [Papaver somniferum]|uniref:Uncharacterized protein n=1 Tax=Papaver somniferum TaxID=3469 RepID=A0A4Y7LHH8_PAPSO|nr:hypothetical protein C5167_047727 [Papaver somniferum]
MPEPPNSITVAGARAPYRDKGALGTFETRVAGEVEVLNIFMIRRGKTKGGEVKIAGCMV